MDMQSKAPLLSQRHYKSNVQSVILSADLYIYKCKGRRTAFAFSNKTNY